MFSNYFTAKKRLFPQSVKGKFRNLKWLLNTIFLSIYLFTPFLRFDRGVGAPNQAILIDLPNSRLYFFSIEIWPQETYYLAGILILAAVILFFVTSLFGRIWCGYACFQTVWTDIFITCEKIFQGDRNQRIILDRKNNFEKFYKKFLTHAAWILVSIVTGYSFVCYFNDAFSLLHNFPNFSENVLGWTFGIALSTYIMAGFAREHVCIYMCPYSRFQSAMFDRNTLIIAYDQKRGEPREKHKQGENFAGRGHCIDCKQCVVVCPQGIDIRDGLQMECIACGLCIDACDNIMDKMNLPRGLIRYDTEANLINPSPQNKFRFFKPRTLYYLAILLVAGSIMIFNLITKSTLEITAIPDRNPLFVRLSNGSIRNGYTLKISNKTHENKIFKLHLITPKDMQIKVSSYENVDENNLPVAKNSVASFKIYLTLPLNFVEQNAQKEILASFLLKENSRAEEKKFSVIFISR